MFNNIKFNSELFFSIEKSSVIISKYDDNGTFINLFKLNCECVTMPEHKHMFMLKNDKDKIDSNLRKIMLTSKSKAIAMCEHMYQMSETQAASYIETILKRYSAFLSLA